MRKQGAEINNINKRLIKMIFPHTEEFLKFKVEQEDLIKALTIKFYVADV